MVPGKGRRSESPARGQRRGDSAVGTGPWRPGQVGGPEALGSVSCSSPSQPPSHVQGWALGAPCPSLLSSGLCTLRGAWAPHLCPVPRGYPPLPLWGVGSWDAPACWADVLTPIGPSCCPGVALAWRRATPTVRVTRGTRLPGYSSLC